MKRIVLLTMLWFVAAAAYAHPPRHLTINGQQWTVAVVPQIDKLSNPGSCQPSKSWSGMTFWDRRRIEIRAGQDPQEELDTLLHELQHAAGPPGAECGTETFHEFIYEGTPRLVKVLVENPKLVDYIAGQVKRIRGVTKATQNGKEGGR